MKTYAFYSTILGFFIGVALGLVGLPAFTISALFLVLSLALIVLFWFQSDSHTAIVIVILLLLSATAGLIRTGFDVGQENEYIFDSFVDQSITAEGVVKTVPELTESGQNFIITLSRIRSNASPASSTDQSRAIVYAGSFPKLNYGDKIILSGDLSKPASFETESGRIFNYPRYLARQEVFYEINQPTAIEVIGREKGNPVKGWLASLRRSLLNIIHDHIPDPHAALTGGVLLGVEDALGERLQSDFRDTGLIHIVVLSGYNVTVVAVAIAAVLLFAGLPLAVASAVAGLGIALFALLVGLTPTVVRASIMAIIALLARVFSRQYAASRGLAIAAVIMVAVNPHILLFDPSFQLSAVATAGLIGFGDKVSSWLSSLPRRFGIREAATATVAAQIAVSPLLIFYTGEISVVSILANLLVLPVVPVLMAAGTATAISGLILKNLALPFASGAYFLSEYIFFVVNKLSNLSFSTASIGSVPILSVFIMYGFLIFVVMKSGRKNKQILNSEL